MVTIMYHSTLTSYHAYPTHLWWYITNKMATIYEIRVEWKFTVNWTLMDELILYCLNYLDHCFRKWHYPVDIYHIFSYLEQKIILYTYLFMHRPHLCLAKVGRPISSLHPYTPLCIYMQSVIYRSKHAQYKNIEPI